MDLIFLMVSRTFVTDGRINLVSNEVGKNTVRCRDRSKLSLWFNVVSFIQSTVTVNDVSYFVDRSHRVIFVCFWLLTFFT